MMQDNNIEYWQKMAGFYTPFMKNNKKMYEAICREVEPILNRKMTVLEIIIPSLIQSRGIIKKCALAV